MTTLTTGKTFIMEWILRGSGQAYRMGLFYYKKQWAED
jgi:hypothetical protein